jgi:prepilin peptidase CpaA
MQTPSDAYVLIAVAAGSATAAVIDLRTRRVPNAVTLSIATVGMAIAASGVGRVSVAAAIGGAVVGVLLLMPGHIFGGTGAGDVKLLGALGTLLGPAATLTAFLATAVTGGVMALAIAVHRRRTGDIDHRFAYAPAIAVGACVAVVGW